MLAMAYGSVSAQNHGGYWATLCLLSCGKVVATGDLVHGYGPLFFPGFSIEPWSKTLKELGNLEVEYHMGGHGDYYQGNARILLWSVIGHYKRRGLSEHTLISDVKSRKVVLRNYNEMTRSSFSHVPSNVHYLYAENPERYWEISARICALYKNQ